MELSISKPCEPQLVQEVVIPIAKMVSPVVNAIDDLTPFFVASPGFRWLGADQSNETAQFDQIEDEHVASLPIEPGNSGLIWGIVNGRPLSRRL